MATSTPKAGKYRITAKHWDRLHESGRRTRYYNGDEVELTDEEATRLAGSRHFPAAVKVSGSGSGSTEESETKQRPQSKGE